MPGLNRIPTLKSHPDPSGWDLQGQRVQARCDGRGRSVSVSRDELARGVPGGMGADRRDGSSGLAPARHVAMIRYGNASRVKVRAVALGWRVLAGPVVMSRIVRKLSILIQSPLGLRAEGFGAPDTGALFRFTGGAPLRIGVYIDGFNLYYGLFKHGPPVCRQYKRLNPFLLGQEMATRLKLSGDVTRVRYFTSRAKHNPEEPGQPTRQHMLVRAMETLPEINVHRGQHIDSIKRGFLVVDPDKAIRNFSTREEKGSDVSLGVFMTRDIALKEIDVALLVSNDSDLMNAVSVAEADFNTRVYIVSPQPSGNLSRKLREAASGLIIVDPDCLAKCWFAISVVDGLGRKIHKPDRW